MEAGRLVARGKLHQASFRTHAAPRFSLPHTHFVLCVDMVARRKAAFLNTVGAQLSRLAHVERV